MGGREAGRLPSRGVGRKLPDGKHGGELTKEPPPPVQVFGLSSLRHTHGEAPPEVGPNVYDEVDPRVESDEEQGAFWTGFEEM